MKKTNLLLSQLDKLNFFFKHHYSMYCDDNYEYIHEQVGYSLEKTKQENIDLYRKKALFYRPIHLDIIDSFPFSVKENQWIYIYIERIEEIACSSFFHDLTLFADDFNISILNCDNLFFSFSYETRVSPISNTGSIRFGKAMNCQEFLLCFDKKSNINSNINHLFSSFASLKIKYHFTKDAIIKKLTTNGDLSNFFKGQFLFDFYSDLYYFGYPRCYFSIYQLDFSVFKYYLLMSYFPDRFISNANLNRYINLRFSLNYNIETKINEIFHQSLESISNNKLRQYLERILIHLGRYYIYIPKDYNLNKKSLSLEKFNEVMIENKRVNLFNLKSFDESSDFN